MMGNCQAGRPQDRPSVDIVIPVLNEAHVLERSVETVRGFLRDHMPYAWRVVIIDNGSTDGTEDIGRRLADLPDVAFMHLDARGRGRALRHAWTNSAADVVCYTDVDLSTELEALPKIINAILKEGYDVATGSRLLRGSTTTRSSTREVVSRTYNLLIKAVLWTSFSDAQCGFKAVSRWAVNEIIPQIKDESWFFDTELLVLAEKQGCRIKDIPVRWTEDDDSRVKIVKAAWEDIKGVLRLRWGLWWGSVPTARPSASLAKHLTS
jgi:glycosyltransferase involved in cell wall biosynthesis